MPNGAYPLRGHRRRHGCDFWRLVVAQHICLHSQPRQLDGEGVPTPPSGEHGTAQRARPKQPHARTLAISVPHFHVIASAGQAIARDHHLATGRGWAGATQSRWPRAERDGWIEWQLRHALSTHRATYQSAQTMHTPWIPLCAKLAGRHKHLAQNWRRHPRHCFRGRATCLKGAPHAVQQRFMVLGVSDMACGAALEWRLYSIVGVQLWRPMAGAARFR